MKSNRFSDLPKYSTTGKSTTQPTISNITPSGNADRMLNIINTCIENALRSVTTLSGAIVTGINTDGTVNVKIPPNDKIFTNIPNQTPFELAPGDCVELMLKNGSFNNCWIIAKHEATFKSTQTGTSEEKDSVLVTNSISAEGGMDARVVGEVLEIF